MEMRIVVPDAASAVVLADRLTDAFGSERISLRLEPREVDVLIDQESESYSLARWVPDETWR